MSFAVVVAVVSPSSFRQFVISGRDLNKMTIIMLYVYTLSVYKLLYSTAVCVLLTQSNRILCQSNRLPRERERLCKRLTTTITSTHKIDPKYVTCFWNYVKTDDTRCPPPFHFVDGINEQNEGIKASASPDPNSFGSLIQSLLGLI